MNVKITLTDKGLRNLPRNLRKAGHALVMNTAAAIEGQAKVAVDTGPRSGEMYGSHQASAPGEAPATDLGNLSGSIQTEEVGEMQARVNVGAEYAAILEYIDRPYLTPAAEGARPAWEAGLKKLFEQALKQ